MHIEKINIFKRVMRCGEFISDRATEYQRDRRFESDDEDSEFSEVFVKGPSESNLDLREPDRFTYSRRERQYRPYRREAPLREAPSVHIYHGRDFSPPYFPASHSRRRHQHRQIRFGQEIASRCAKDLRERQSKLYAVVSDLEDLKTRVSIPFCS